MSLLLIALSLLYCLTVLSVLTLLVRSGFRCLLNKDRRQSETTGIILFYSAEVRTKNGMSVNKPGLDWHLHKSFHSLSPIEFIQERNNIKKSISLETLFLKKNYINHEKYYVEFF